MKLNHFLILSLSTVLFIAGSVMLLNKSPKDKSSEKVIPPQKLPIDLKKTEETPPIENIPSREKHTKDNYQLLFYNVENLFDTLDDPHKNDNEFLPTSAKKWNSDKYSTRLSQLANVIAGSFHGDLPEVIGLAEVENKQVVRDLFSTGELGKFKWEIFLPESPDQRGIDVAIVYQVNRFKQVKEFYSEIDFPKHPHSETRNIAGIEVTTRNDQKFHFLVNHWPSRLGGEERSVPKRVRAAEVLRSMVDSLQKVGNQFLIICGDFNDTPADSSLEKVLAANEVNTRQKNELINLSYRLYKEGKGTSTYKGKWVMLDQLIVSDALLEKKNLIYSESETRIIQLDGMTYTKGKKTLVKRAWQGKELDPEGFSDHLPVGIELIEN